MPLPLGGKLAPNLWDILLGLHWRELWKISMTDNSRTLAELFGSKAREVVPDRRPKLCDDCGKNLADYPSRLCPGCEAYLEHQR
jgi:hypothetical protein